MRVRETSVGGLDVRAARPRSQNSDWFSFVRLALPAARLSSARAAPFAIQRVCKEPERRMPS